MRNAHCNKYFALQKMLGNSEKECGWTFLIHIMYAVT